VSTVPLDHVLLLSAALFLLGLLGLLVRRNILFMLISIEVMLNAAGLAFVAAGARWGSPTGR
jgi:NADH-quinone oxidoreductase subunit K